MLPVLHCERLTPLQYRNNGEVDQVYFLMEIETRSHAWARFGTNSREHLLALVGDVAAVR